MLTLRFGPCVCLFKPPQVLAQFNSFASFFLDGFANAAEASVGAAVGARDRVLMRQNVIDTCMAACLVALLLATVFLACGGGVVDALTTLSSVRAVAHAHLLFAVVAPLRCAIDDCAGSNLAVGAAAAATECTRAQKAAQ